METKTPMRPEAPKHGTLRIPEVVSLDRALAKLSKGGAKVVDFWREGSGWRVKFMNRRDS
jgi:hypothetical protein